MKEETGLTVKAKSTSPGFDMLPEKKHITYNIDLKLIKHAVGSSGCVFNNEIKTGGFSHWGCLYLQNCLAQSVN